MKCRTRPPAPSALAAAALLLAAGAGGCHQDASGRREVFARAGRIDTTIAAGAVVRDLRAPPDSARILYTRPTPLRLDTAPKAAAAPALSSSPSAVSTPGSAPPAPGAPPPARR